MAKIKVINPGLATFVEDSGRYGYYHLGIPPGGALDQMSFKAGNLLLGNDVNAAALEVALMGPTLEFEDGGFVAITGAEMTPIVNGEKKASHSVIEIPKGGTLSFDFLRGGARSYICVKGGIDCLLLWDLVLPILLVVLVAIKVESWKQEICCQ